MADHSKEARQRAEARREKLQKAALERESGRADYEAEGKAVAAKTLRLRALRLAKEAAEAGAQERPASRKTDQRRPTA